MNPTAAGGRAARVWAAIASELPDVEAHLTTARGHATELAEAAVRAGAGTILAMGGDGTNNEVINGIMAANPAPGAVTLGLLPSGTGGDFRRLLAHGTDARTAAAHLGAAASTPIDVGRLRLGARTHWFLNVASIGLSGDIVRRVNISRKLLPGRLAFLVAALRAYRRWTPARVRLFVDDSDQGEFDILAIAAGNGRFFGGGMMIAPEARLADGQLDVTVWQADRFLRVLGTVPSFYDGGHVRSAIARTFRGGVVRAELLDGIGAIEADGEPVGDLPVVIDLLPGAINLLDARPEVL